MAEAAKKQEITVVSKIQSGKESLTARLPKGIDKDKFILGIMTAIHRSKAVAKPGSSLADCDPNSVLLAACDAAEVGCNLSPSLALGWLIPYGKEAQFQPSYRFFIQKAYETGDVKTFYAEVVHKGDTLDRQYAPKKNLFHAPGPRTDVKMTDAVGAYALIEFMDGTIDWEYMSAEQIDRHRKASKQPNSMKWTTFWEEGWRITPIRVMSKRLPLKNRAYEQLIEMANRDAERDLVISPEESAEPAVPRRASERPAEASKLPETTEPEPASNGKEEPQTENTKPEQAAQTTNGGSMFNEEDPYLSPAEISDFWEKALGAGWKKTEVIDFMKTNYNIQALKDLKKSQLAGALEKILQTKK